ncbi:hypothetical protein [Leifsonia shinshuensis]
MPSAQVTVERDGSSVVVGVPAARPARAVIRIEAQSMALPCPVRSTMSMGPVKPVGLPGSSTSQLMLSLGSRVPSYEPSAQPAPFQSPRWVGGGDGCEVPGSVGCGVGLGAISTVVTLVPKVRTTGPPVSVTTLWSHCAVRNPDPPTLRWVAT